MKIYTLEEDELLALVDIVMDYMREKLKEPERWIDGEDAMKKLGVSSPTTLQKYRDEGKIRFSQPSRKIILYDRLSIDEFLEKNARETF